MDQQELCCAFRRAVAGGRQGMFAARIPPGSSLRPHQDRHCERQRSNPDLLRRHSLDCFVASAPRNDGVTRIVIASDSEAIQTCSADTAWVASSPALLAMTE